MKEPVHRISILNATLVGLLLAACGSRQVETISGPPGCPLPPTAPPPTSARLLDDLEDGDMNLIAGDGLDGSWEFWDDKTNSNLLMANSTMCAAFGKFAVHARSDGQTGWGASVNLFFRAPPPRPRPYDGSRFNAVSFYAAIIPPAVGVGSDADANPTVRIKAAISTMETAWEGNCKSCTDNFAKYIEISNRWQRFVLPFSELRQEGWGDPKNLAFKTNDIVQLAIQLGQKFDLWIDQVAFEQL
jgi:hypothetical protein